MNANTHSQSAGFRWIGIGALLGLATVGLGAFGAHGLADYFADLSKTDLDLAVRRIGNWNTAAEYQMYHALAIVLTGLMMLNVRSKLLTVAGFSFCVGIIFFSGLLYALVLTETPILGAFVMIGGLSFIGGWICLAMAAFKLSLGAGRDTE